MQPVADPGVGHVPSGHTDYNDHIIVRTKTIEILRLFQHNRNISLSVEKTPPWSATLTWWWGLCSEDKKDL